MAHLIIFEEDEIFQETDKGIKYGLVLESAEYISSDEEEEEEIYWDRLKKGTVRVAWHPDGTEEVISEKDLKLTDRSLMPGDVVRRLIEGQDSQRGYIRSTQVSCHVQILGKHKVICGVNSRDLDFLVQWDEETGDVYYNSWVGRIDKITDKIILRFSDGAKVKVDTDDFYTELAGYEDIHEKRDRDSEFCVNNYYPGQRLKGSMGELQHVEWLVTTKHYNPEQAKKKDYREVMCTVEQVETESIDVTWLCQGYSKSDLQKTGQPPKTLEKEQIKKLFKLNCFEACSIQIGDHAFYELKEDDIVHNIPQKGRKTIINHIIKNKLYNKTKTYTHDNINALNVKNAAYNDLQNTESSQAGDQSICAGDAQINASTEQNASGDQNINQEKVLAKQNSNTPSQESDAQSIEIDQEHGTEEWEDDAEFDDVSDAESSCSASSALSSSSNPSKKKKTQHKKGGSIQTKLLKKKKLRKSRKKEDMAMWEFKPGDRLPVEVIATYSVAEVMWQDGTIEQGIKSTELYPIHHLDEQEFFPGDFVLSNDGGNEHEYGVVQSVDHAGRTCVLRWVKPYDPGSTNSKPIDNKPLEEVSVYDLKDHSDYKFRPGALVVRVGGYEENANVSAGQVFELQLDGRIDVMWVDRTRSFVYPQELYLIGDDLSELSELDEESDSCSSSDSGEESWETEGEEEELDPDEEDQGAESDPDYKGATAPRRDVEAMETRHNTVIEAMQRLEEGFALTDRDFDQSTCYEDVVHLYKACKKLDTKRKTSYFDNAKLRKLMVEVKEEMKKDKTARFAKKIQELIQHNVWDNFMQDDEKTEEPLSEEAAKEKEAKAKPEAPTSPTVDQGTQTSEASCDRCTSHTRDLCQRAVHMIREIFIESVGSSFAKEQENKSTTNADAPNENEVESQTCDREKAEACSSSTENGSLDQKSAVNTDSIPESTEPSNENKANLTLDICTANDDVSADIDVPATPVTPSDVREKILYNVHGFTIEESAPTHHKFLRHDHQPVNAKLFMSTVMKDHKILNSSLPLDIFVKGFEDRMDLYSVMIHGPENTPYEDGLFFFDVELPNDYPTSPPKLHYIAYCSDRLNPNLYEDGKVCVSLLGTWTGKGTEVWTCGSTLLQVLISIQGLILVSEPYYNEAGYERQKGTQQGLENSRMYNEMALIKMLQSMTKICKNPPEIFKAEVQTYVSEHGPKMLKRLQHWLDNAVPASGATIPIQDNSPKPAHQKSSNPQDVQSDFEATGHEESDSKSALRSSSDEIGMPEFPLLPVSKGFVLTLKKLLVNFRKVLQECYN